MIDRGKPICPLTKKPLKQTIGMIETMQPSFHVKNGTVQALQRILQRMPSEIPTPSQQALHNIDATQRAPFQVFLRKQGLSLNSSQQQLQRAWVRYKRIKAMSLKKK
jgi:LAS superfamily LD-carboxypeptidase LdcB